MRCWARGYFVALNPVEIVPSRARKGRRFESATVVLADLIASGLVAIPSGRTSSRDGLQRIHSAIDPPQGAREPLENPKKPGIGLARNGVTARIY